MGLYRVVNPDKWAPSELALKIYMSDLDSFDLDPMEQLGLPADEASYLLSELNLLHMKNGTYPRREGRNLDSSIDEINIELVKSGILLRMDQMKLRPIPELLEKLREPEEEA